MDVVFWPSGLFTTMRWAGILQTYNLPSLSSVYWDYAMTIRLEEIVYLHCHQQGRAYRGSAGLGRSTRIPCLPLPIISCGASDS